MNGTPKMIQPSYLLKLTWPVFVELILQMLVGNMDQFMVGQYSQLSVGAIGNANQILNVLIITFSVISTAAMILISQYLGANDRAESASAVYVVFYGQYGFEPGNRCSFTAVQRTDFPTDEGAGGTDERIAAIYQYHWRMFVFAGNAADPFFFFPQPRHDEGIDDRISCY